jgi:hypothetical protein
LFARQSASFSALRKCKIKRLDLFFVTLANSFLRERVGKQKLQLQLQLKKYENPSSNQQKSGVYTYTHLGCGSPCACRGSIGVPSGIAAGRRSAGCTPAAFNSKIL